MANISDFRSFVSGVTQTYDQAVLHKPADLQAGIASHNGKIISMGISRRLPKELVAHITSFAPTMTEWVALSGIFNLEASKSAVEESIKIKLRELKIAPSRIHSASSQIMTHIFTEAFAAASPERKARIIQEVEKHYPALEKSYSRAKRTSIKVSQVAGNVFRNPIVQAALAITAAVISVNIYLAIRAYFPNLIASTIGRALPSIINHCPIAIIRLGNALATAVDFVARRQLAIALISYIFAMGRIPGSPWAFEILLLPSTLFWLPVTIAHSAFNLAHRGTQKIEQSLKNISGASEREWLRVGSEKALRVWLELGDRVHAERRLA